MAVTPKIKDAIEAQNVKTDSIDVSNLVSSSEDIMGCVSNDDKKWYNPLAWLTTKEVRGETGE